MKKEQKYMPSIGNCDTCDYALQCDRVSIMLPSFAKALKGCPKRLVEQYYKDCKNERTEETHV